MVRGFFAVAHVGVNLAGLQTVCGLWAEQEVVNADAVVFLARAGLIIPERIGFRGAGRDAQGVGQTEVQQAAIGVAGLGQKQGVLVQTSGRAASSACGITL